ncbi:hypothetical protein HAV15_006335 [Penicillium sp. str. |nr:hypothetical protein HAV15_006335 [Penicillium sp. str. \
MAARTLDRMRKAQSLLRECHDWPPFNGYRRRNRRGSHNGYRRVHPANRGGTEASAGRAGGGQNVMAQAAESTSKGIVNKSTCPGASPKPPQARSAVAEASPPTGVHLNFNDDVEFVQLPPSVLASMETAQTADLGSKEKERSTGWFAACSSDQPALGVEVRLDGDDVYQTIPHTAHAAPAELDTPVSSYCPPPAVEGVISVSSRPDLPGSPACDTPEDGLPHVSQNDQPVNGTNESKKRDSKNCEESPVSTATGGVTEGMLTNLDDDLAVILPTGIDAGTDSTIHPEEKDALAASLDSGVEHSHQPDDLEDDEIAFQGNAAKILGPDFKALFVSSDDDSQTARRPIDLKAIFEKYSEVVICR